MHQSVPGLGREFPAEPAVGHGQLVVHVRGQHPLVPFREHLGQQYAKWQLPERFEMIEEIPRTATGKFKKTKLRAQFVEAPAPERAPA